MEVGQISDYLNDGYALECDADPQQVAKRLVQWEGPGWYSLDDDGFYVKGVIPTTSRIKII